MLEDRVEHAALGLAGIDEPDDIRMGEPGAEVHLPPEAVVPIAHVVRALARVRAQELDGDVLTRRKLARPVHRAEAARARQGGDLVLPLEQGAGCEGGV